MSCPSELVCSMHADRALPAAEAAVLEAHLRSCASCRDLVDALRGERQLLAAALRDAPETAIPPFRRPISVTGLLGLWAAVAGAACGVRWIWDVLAALPIPVELRRLNPFGWSNVWDAVIGVAVYVSREGSAMLTSLINAIGIAVLVAILAWAAFGRRRFRAGAGALLVVLVLVGAGPSIGHALEIRRSDGLVTIGANETIDDTLVITGESVAVDGAVDGDLIAVARRVVIRGRVTGDVITAAVSVAIEGEVDGNVYGVGRTLELSGAHVGRNLYGGGRDVSVDGDSGVTGNAALFASDAVLDGTIGRDLVEFANNLELSGSVARNVRAFNSGRVTLLDSARIGRDLTVRLGNVDNLQIATGAIVTGTIDTRASERLEPRSRYATVSFYAGQAPRLAAAFVVGFLLFWLFPALRWLRLVSVAQGLKTGGIGLLELVAVPVVSVFVGITIIGLPIAVLAMLAWIAGLYLAKIVLADFLGRVLLVSPTHHPPLALTLLAGLAVVIVAVNLPWIGGLLNLVLTIFGLGMLAEQLFDCISGRRDTPRSDA